MADFANVIHPTNDPDQYTIVYGDVDMSGLAAAQQTYHCETCADNDAIAAYLTSKGVNVTEKYELKYQLK